MARGALLFFILYLALGVYFLNIGFNFFDMPSFLADIQKWIIVVGGVFLIFGAFNFLKARNASRPR